MITLTHARSSDAAFTSWCLIVITSAAPFTSRSLRPSTPTPRQRQHLAFLTNNISCCFIMTDKHGSADGSEQKAKEQRDESSAAVPSSVASRAAHAAALVEQAQLDRMQLSSCSKLAQLVHSGDARPMDQRAADVTQLLQEDEKRAQPLLNLSHKLSVS